MSSKNHPWRQHASDPKSWRVCILCDTKKPPERMRGKKCKACVSSKRTGAQEVAAYLERQHIRNKKYEETLNGANNPL